MNASLSFQHLAADLRLHCGEDSLAALVKELKRNGCRRAVVVSGRSVSVSPAMDLLRAALGPLLVGESPSVRPNSPVPAVEEAARVLREQEADAVIAVGGGSAAVSARAAAVLLAEQRPAQELCTRRLPSGQFESPRLDAPKLPQFVVPTTPSTAFVKAGSAVHDEATGQRLALFDPKTRARALFLHPAFLRTAPHGLVQGAALNTLSTAVEALESPRCDPISEAMLMHALRLVARHIGRVEPDDIAAREYLVLAAVLCGRGTEQAGGGLASVLAHAIGHRAHASNGIVNAIVLPHTMRFNEPATIATSGRISEALGSAQTSAAEVLERLLAPLPIPHRLREIGLAQLDLDAIANAAMSDFFISRSARRVQGVSDVRGILDAAW
ncbi:iron-containing alcohol dehydrogenase family protein [Variovorax paradoxus]|uniref:iron-containing alcohol dehydrogenase family protein n=1 Tax=Variovorax paradoxus TaxID=34073 RepID=UPI0021AC81BA|nr:iron-containing alcohol dehydrogenase family protein [Variovorax paradoxus]UVH60661.1 iron-containing alcohol dehydrogenase family protein [Variovorax paradoxus]